MNTTVSSVRCCLQVALLGAVTPNLRGVNVNFSDEVINIYFYYEKQPSDEEVELSQIISTEVLSYFGNVAVNEYREVLPLPQRMPEMNLKVYHRHEIL